MSGLCEAYYEAVQAVARVHGGPPPLPPGLTTVELPSWTLTVNNGKEPIDDVPPFAIRAVHKEYLVFALFDPTGGCIGGGVTEDEFIEQMRATPIANDEELIWRLYAPKSAARIDEAAKLIRKAAHLLDQAGDRFVIAEIEKIEGSEAINSDLAVKLEALATRLEGEGA